ncbi:MAG: ferredoxin family protein [Firmicutes bacterium]|nr:ferredoxin family protein [Alicyclobacillaceae bacterium]MCL6497810.1 ferredoxin family protein [Bacillota bacterium]
MPHVITARCIDVKDQSCVQVCPVDCIHPVENVDGPLFDEAPQLYIDPNTCIDCGACVPECPVEAIFEESELPEEFKDYARINAEYYQTHSF